MVYRLTNAQIGSFEGGYLGMAAIGTDTALVFDVEGRRRMVMASLIVTMDELEAAPAEPERKDPGSAYYG